MIRLFATFAAVSLLTAAAVAAPTPSPKPTGMKGHSMMGHMKATPKPTHTGSMSGSMSGHGMMAHPAPTAS